MSGRLSRIAVFSAALAAFGMSGALTSTASAAPTGTTAMHFITHYSSESQCQGGGAYYVRHGYSSYYCLRESAGWGLYVWD
ncbi:hypothetical protein ACGFYE_28915 [Streptomyces zaomyceticus]|uniref:hypothetical protein n=1 Tax=Streptomyces zaomyceticus TaxID=68286 RepID=UPI0034465D10